VHITLVEVQGLIGPDGTGRDTFIVPVHRADLSPPHRVIIQGVSAMAWPNSKAVSWWAKNSPTGTMDCVHSRYQGSGPAQCPGSTAISVGTKLLDHLDQAIVSA